MKNMRVSDTVTAILFGVILYFAGAPFWFVAAASLGMIALFGVLNILMEALDVVGEALDAVMRILKDKQG